MISKSPPGLLTPSPVVRSEAKAILPLLPGKVAPAGFAGIAASARSRAVKIVAAIIVLALDDLRSHFRHPFFLSVLIVHLLLVGR